MKFKLLSALLFAALSPLTAHAVHSCEGSLTQDNFADERKQLQKELQKNIYDYRKLEASTERSADDKAQMGKIMSEIELQKTRYKELNDKHFPTTPVTAFGSACNDRRWLDNAKSKLVEKPEHLGKHWYVWLDKTSRKPQAALERPSFGVMAE